MPATPRDEYARFDNSDGAGWPHGGRLRPRLRFGGAVSYLTSGSQSLAQGATFNATADNDWAYAISGSYKISF